MKYLSLPLCAILGFGAVSAQAASAPLNLEVRPYVGIDGSYSFAEISGANISDEDIALGALGVTLGLNLNDFFGIEARGAWGVSEDGLYVPAGGGLPAANVDYSIKQYYAGFAKLRSRQLHGFSAHALLGAAYMELEEEVKGPTPALSYTSEADETEFAFGVGGNYHFNSNISTTLEYLRLNDDFDTVNVGLRYSF